MNAFLENLGEPGMEEVLQGGAYGVVLKSLLAQKGKVNSPTRDAFGEVLQDEILGFHSFIQLLDQCVCGNNGDVSFGQQGGDGAFATGDTSGQPEQGDGCLVEALLGGNPRLHGCLALSQ